MSTWLEMSEADLLLEMGRAVSSRQRHAVPPSPTQLVQAAKDWLRANAGRFSGELCTSDRIRKYAHMKEGELLFEAACELLVHVVAHVPAGCVAAYLIRQGVDKLCANHWCETDDSNKPASG